MIMKHCIKAEDVHYKDNIGEINVADILINTE